MKIKHYHGTSKEKAEQIIKTGYLNGDSCCTPFFNYASGYSVDNIYITFYREIELIECLKYILYNNLFMNWILYELESREIVIFDNFQTGRNNYLPNGWELITAQEHFNYTLKLSDYSNVKIEQLTNK